MNNHWLKILSYDPILEWLLANHSMPFITKVLNKFTRKNFFIVLVEYNYFLTNKEKVIEMIKTTNVKSIIYNIDLTQKKLLATFFKMGFNAVIGKESIEIELVKAVDSIYQNSIYYPNIELY